MFTDCPTGKWIEYHQNGKPKITGTWLGDSTGRYDTTVSTNWCGIKDGEWKYYNEAGQLDSTVKYLRGKRINQF